MLLVYVSLGGESYVKFLQELDASTKGRRKRLSDVVGDKLILTRLFKPAE